MNIIDTYWKHISKQLTKEHPEGKPPAEWTKIEVESFSSNKMFPKTSKTIHHSTLQRIFKGGKGGGPTTKDMFANYYGYDTYGDYIEQEIKKKRKRIILWLFWGIFACLIFSLYYYNTQIKSPLKANINNKTTINKEDSLAIIHTIKNSINYQFTAFKAIPNFEPYLDTLLLFYQKGEPAYLEIIDILEGNTGHSWVITNNPNLSRKELKGEIKIDSIINNQAYISTREHWRLDWFSYASQQIEYSYETENNQKYVLNKDTIHSNWKISMNTYSGDKYRYIPRYIHCDSIIDKTQNISVAKQSTRKAIENDGLDLALKTLNCFYQKDTALKFPNKLSLLLAEKTELLRAVNTDVINQEVFESRKNELFEDILVFLDGL